MSAYYYGDLYEIVEIFADDTATIRPLFFPVNTSPATRRVRLAELSEY